MEYLITIGIAIIIGTGGMWYMIGKLTSEVRYHNKKLTKIEQLLNKLTEEE